MSIFTHKNKEQFDKWLEDYSDKDQSEMVGSMDIYVDEIFDKIPFEMKSGLLFKYCDEMGFTVEVNKNPTTKSWYFMINDSSDEYGDLRYNTRSETEEQAFRYVDVLINLGVSTDDVTRIKLNCLGENLHRSFVIQQEVDDVILNAFKEHEPHIYDMFDFDVTSDWYDNSVTIIFKVSLPYPYEPCKAIREKILELGFSRVDWRFDKDVMDVECDRISPPPPGNIYKNSPDEIRGNEPRHSKHGIWKPTKYGFVDDRFNEDEWVKNYK